MDTVCLGLYEHAGAYTLVFFDAGRALMGFLVAGVLFWEGVFLKLGIPCNLLMFSTLSIRPKYNNLC